ncbi:MAG: hypothetical protein Q9161_009085 [Pseudevernia consocians]
MESGLTNYILYKRQGPLWEKVEDALGEEEPEKFGWARATSNWARLLNIITSHPNRSQFDATLLERHRVSWRILLDWWEGHFQDEGLSRAARAALSTSERPPEAFEATHASDESKKYSLYHAIMFNLFEIEFHPHRVDWENHTDENAQAVFGFLWALDQKRQIALEHSTAQKIAFSHYKLGGDFSKHLNSTLEPCPWLQETDRKTGYPYYLWDIAGRQTVRTGDLGDFPAYTCISHTWGRWQVKGSFVDVGNVPWQVPENTRFEVGELPSIFRERHWETKYLWFDLFCIPQDRSPIALVEISRQAGIFRGANSCMVWFNDVQCWTGVSAAVQWLSIKYLQDTSLSGLYQTEEMLESASIAAASPVELIQTSQDVEHPKTDNFPGSSTISTTKGLARPAEMYSSWFSSLWTLQEACMCPSLGLLSKYWEPLKSPDGALITLDALFALSKNVRDSSFQSQEARSFEDTYSYLSSRRTEQVLRGGRPVWDFWPTGPKQLDELARRTKIENVLRSSRADVLVMGNMRQCTASRAEAIMSVVGATDWFTSHLSRTGQSPSEKRLVLGMYPLAFVQEAARKIGGLFYCMCKSTPHSPPFFTGTFKNRSTGSMLPFSIPGNSPSVVAMASEGRHTEDHPTIQSWCIKNNGNVKIMSAGILASSESSSVSQVRAWVAMTDGRTSDFGEEELSPWLHQQSKRHLWFAIAAFRDSTTLNGLILKGKRMKPSHRVHLINVGYFQTADREFPPAQNVNWIIL